jgi:16S rRNA processing protein RimM
VRSAECGLIVDSERGPQPERNPQSSTRIPQWEEMALVGRIARAHGIRGQVIVNPESDFAGERFQTGAELYLERGGSIEKVRVTSARFHRERPVIGIEGVESMNDANALAGKELRVPVDQLAALPADTFYRHDLIGCRVETTAGETVGTVEDVEGTIGRSRLVVKGAKGDVLVPLASAICRTIDPAGKRIVIDPPAGLLDLNARSG